MFKKEKKTATLKKFQYLGIIYLFIGIGCMAPKLMPITKEIKEEFKVYNDVTDMDSYDVYKYTF